MKQINELGEGRDLRLHLVHYSCKTVRLSVHYPLRIVLVSELIEQFTIIKLEKHALFQTQN